MNILDFNEFKVNLQLLLLIEFCRKQGSNGTLLIQNHRSGSGITYNNRLLLILLEHYSNQFEIIYEQNYPILSFSNGFILKLINGYTSDTIKQHKEFKNICSFSLMGGLEPTYLPGTLTLPTKSMRFNVDNNELDFTTYNTIENSYIKYLDDILSIDQTQFFEILNKYPSQNPNKTHNISSLNKEDFKLDTTILQINKLYDPEVEHFDDPVTIYFNNVEDLDNLVIPTYKE
jgi:hypothetical protein